jgi:hypothetical protein
MMIDDFEGDDFDDLIHSFEQIRTNPSIPPDALIEIEKAHKIFLQNVTESPEIALQAYGYGMIIGAHDTGHDDGVLALADRLLKSWHQSQAGKASGKRRQKKPWHKHAKDLAVKARHEKPTLSQERVAEEIQAKWKSRTTRVRLPSRPTLKNFVADLEKAGELPRRSTIRKS